MAALDDTEEQSHPPERPAQSRPVLALVGVTILAAIVGPPLASWQRLGQQRARSLTNLRRLADAWQLYNQDWDDRSVLAAEALPNGDWVTWPRRLDSYGATASILDNPANAVTDVKPLPRDPVHGYPVSTSYALNRRFWNTFAPGPFPVDNLELPAQTVLFVEAGPCWKNPMQPTSTSAGGSFALLEYGDSTDRVHGLVPYPSTHDGKLAIVAADGHTVLVKVEHYSEHDGPHDTLLGRFGGDIYNWNGGRPNGEIERPPQE